MILSFKDEDVHKFMQYIEKLAKDYELNLPNRSYDIYAFAKDLLVWLEKQGEPNPYSGVSFKYNGHTWGMCARDNGVEILVDAEIKERIFLDNEPQGKSALEAIKEEKVDNEPKFKVGDWVVNKFGDSYHIDSLDKKNYQVSDGKGNYNYFPISQQDKMHLWTIKDAKDGDVLVGKDDRPFIFTGEFDVQDDNPTAYCGINSDDKFITGKGSHWTFKDGIKPATKEQRDLLFQKMKEASYEWDADKKELKKLVPNRFDPKTLQPFDKVLVRDKNSDNWCCGYFSHINVSFDVYRYVTGGTHYKMCIPHNDETKHLVGTTEKAPEYYRYWED